MAMGNMQKNLVKFGCKFFELSEWTDGQTDRQRHRQTDANTHRRTHTDSMKYEMEGARPRGRPKKTWSETVEKDCQARGLNREDAMDRIRWMKQIRGD